MRVMIRVLVFSALAGILFCDQVRSQILPPENGKLNYRLVGFSFPATPGKKISTLELAMGKYSTEAAFRKNIFRSIKTEKNQLVAEVPCFGKDYTWRTEYTAKGVLVKSAFHHFSVPMSSDVDTSDTRLKILKNDGRYHDAYVFIDGATALYDMNGNPVWHLPETKKIAQKKNKIWDMKLTPQGTITFIGDQNIYEINYNGDILWQGPNNGKVSGDNIEYYHHEFTRLNNGRYMVLGAEFAPGALYAYKDTTNTDTTGKAKFERKAKTMWGTVIEYDHEGNVVWSWKSSQYFAHIDPKYLISDIYTPGTPKNIVDVHENAFYFDENEMVVYLSFKNISTILKIKYPEGDVLNVYGKLAEELKGALMGQVFCGQHSCKTNEDGQLYLYNNNACHGNALPQVQYFEQPKSTGDSLHEIWEYTCDFADVMNEKVSEGQALYELAIPAQLSSLNIFSKGGNVIELPDKSLFVSICGAYGKVFILTKDKKTLWSALPQTRNHEQNKWEDIANYKANMIFTSKEMERLIFDPQKKMRD